MIKIFDDRGCALLQQGLQHLIHGRREAFQGSEISAP
jgi:hypothetical protein